MPSTGILRPITPARAVVVPRGYPQGGGETLPLETHVAAAIRRDVKQIVIVGGIGAGKTTALAHLASLADFADCDFVDGEVFVPSSSNTPTISSFVDPPAELSPRHAIYHLAPWGESERIDYLLARHASAVRPVMERLRASGPADELEGNPRLWTLVLDQFAARPTLTDIDQLLHETLHAVLAMFGDAADETRRRMAACEALGPEAFNVEGVPRLLRHPQMLRLALVDELLDSLSTDEWKRGWWPRMNDRPDVIAALVRELRSRPGRAIRLHERLTEAGATDVWSVHSIFTGVLVSLDPEYRPPPEVMLLQRLHASGARWSGLDLARRSLSKSDLSFADLSEACLSCTRLIQSDLTRANLAHADLSGAQLRESMLNEASLPHAILRSADLLHVSAVAANFNAADLTAASLDHTDLTGASLKNAELSKAVLNRTGLAAADLTGACLDRAHGLHLDLRDTILNDIRGRDIALTQSNLSGVQAQGVRLRESNFTGTDFTGSILTDAVFAGSSFRQAGLADIEWQDADLRDCDFTYAAFHMGSSRSGLVGSPIACEGSRTGFYTDDYSTQDYQPPEAIRKANLCGANLVGAKVTGTDWYLVDLRGARYTSDQARWFRKCGAILFDRRG